MGWSSSAVAGDVMFNMAKKSFEQSGFQNVYKHGSKWFMWEVNRKEHEDGSITGSIFEHLGEPHDERAGLKRAGIFRIDGRTGDIRGSYGIKKLKEVM